MIKSFILVFLFKDNKKQKQNINISSNNFFSQNNSNFDLKKT